MSVNRRELEELRLLQEIDRKVSRQTWLRDFSSNIAGNAAWDTLLWIGRKLLRL